MPSPHRLSDTASLGNASFSGSPERALALLAERGALILDDDRYHLEAVASVCTELFEIPETRVARVHVRPGMSLRDIVEEVKAQLQGSVTSQGACFGSLLTDFKLSSSITSLEVWRSVDEAFTDTIYQAPWQRTARVLMTATIDEPAITNAQTTGLIDSYIHKPFKLSDLRNAVVTSILGRMV